MSDMVWLMWISGAAAGAVGWSALLRFPGRLARWLCAPYGKPDRLGAMVALALALVFLMLAIIGMMIGLSSLFFSETTPDSMKRKVRGIIALSSLIGYALLPIVIRLERSMGGRKKQRGRK